MYKNLCTTGKQLLFTVKAFTARMTRPHISCVMECFSVDVQWLQLQKVKLKL